jgi:hypothetical protein
MSAVMTSIVLTDGVSVQDVIRALRHSGLAVSNTGLSNTFAIKPSPRNLDLRIVDLPALLRPQAE